MKKVLLASACVLAFSVSSASAQNWALTLDGGYTHASVSGFSADGYYIDGAAAVPLNWSNISVELDLGDRGLSSAHNFDGGGSVVWNGSNLRLAGTVSYNKDTISGTDLNETQIGGGVEFYANHWLTASFQGGGLTGDFGGSYVGGTLKGYLIPDLSVSGGILYTTINSAHETDYGIRGEWQVSDSFPVAVNAGYTRAQLSGGAPGIDVFQVGLTLHLNGMNSTLEDTNRSGTLDTIGAIHPVVFTF